MAPAAGVSQLELAPELGPLPILCPLGQGTTPGGNACIAEGAWGRDTHDRGELNLLVP